MGVTSGNAGPRRGRGWLGKVGARRWARRKQRLVPGVGMRD